MKRELRNKQRKALKELKEERQRKADEEAMLRQRYAERVFRNELIKDDEAQDTEVEEALQQKLSEEEKQRAEIEKAREAERKRKDKDSWDVTLEDPVEFFDPELSYELTGYRPITMTKGLDFDPAPFCEDARIFEATDHYTTFIPGSKAYNDFWVERKERCMNGYTVGRYTVTGDHYFFLNYYRLLRVDSVSETGSGRGEGFPRFFAEQYKYFHYIALCERLKKDVGALKARGVGFSEIAASLGVRLYTTTPNTICNYTAFSEGYVTKVLRKCWDQLEFLNTRTDGGFKHLRQAKDSDMEKRASKINKTDHAEVGHKATILGTVADNPRKIRGDRVDRLFFEEAGSNPVLVTTYNQCEALVCISGTKFGTRFVWGTGGDAGAPLAGLANMFNNPQSYGILPYRHNYTQTGEYVNTGFFVPAFTMVNQFMDERGVCDEIAAKQYYNTERLKKSDDPRNLLEYKSEYCFFPEEALIREGENQFDQVKLAEQLANIELHKLVEKPRNANLTWQFDADQGGADRSKTPRIEYIGTGKVEILEEPMRDENGLPYSNLYIAGIDSIDADSSTSTGQNDVSKFAMVIKRRQIGLKEPTYVATYIDRPKDVRDAFEMAMKLCKYYNAKAMVEATRVTVIKYFQERKMEYYLFRRPQASIGQYSGRNRNMYGCPASQGIIEHQLDLIGNYINDYYLNIHHAEIIKQLMTYSYANKKKFDFVAAMGMCELADEDLAGKTPDVQNKYKNEWRDIGYYYDENGVKRYGVIPRKGDNTVAYDDIRRSQEYYRNSGWVYSSVR
jgi:hypothetical protein